MDIISNCKPINSMDELKKVSICDYFLRFVSQIISDISNRILRVDNYKVAMINKNVLPYSFTFPILGQRIFLSKVFMANLEFILFSGPWAPFKYV